MKENIKKYLGLKVKVLRETSHLTQEELSVICDVSWRTISNLERGLVIPELPMILKIAHHFKVPLDELLNTNISDKKTLLRLEKELLVSEKIKSVDDRLLNYLEEEIDLLLRRFR